MPAEHPPRMAPRIALPLPGARPVLTCNTNRGRCRVIRVRYVKARLSECGSSCQVYGPTHSSHLLVTWPFAMETIRSTSVDFRQSAPSKNRLRNKTNHGAATGCIGEDYVRVHGLPSDTETRNTPTPRRHTNGQSEGGDVQDVMCDVWCILFPAVPMITCDNEGSLPSAMNKGHRSVCRAQEPSGKDMRGSYESVSGLTVQTHQLLCFEGAVSR